jgi:hypothetical protein
VAANEPDNAVAEGQLISVFGTGTTLGFLGASSDNQEGGAGTVFYSDGSTSTYWITLDNFWDGPVENSVVATTASYVNSSGDEYSRTLRIFYTGVPIPPGKTVRAVTLPSTSLVPPGSEISGMHVFAVAVGGG